MSGYLHVKFKNPRVTMAGKRLVFYFLIGLIAGLGSIIFHYMCQVGSHVFLELMAGYRPPAPSGELHLFHPAGVPFRRWMLLFLPALGGIVSGWLVYTFAPEAEGHGTDAAIDAYHNKGGFIRGRIPIIKTIASAVTLTTGGSGGREGPIAQIGAGFGSFLATKLKLSERDRRIMLAAGMGAGVGSIFRAPLAGALFAAEVLYKDPEFESEVIIPAGIASVVAYCLFCLVFGWGSLFSSPHFIFRNPLELGPYVVLAFVLAGGGYLYVKAFYGIHGLFKWHVHIPNHLKPALGGLFTGAIGFFLPHTLSFGYGFVQMAIENQLPTLFLLGLAFGKILTTSFSIGSGGSGGVFGPSVVIGGAFGGAVGRIFHEIMPSVVTAPGAFVIVGMAGFFSAVSNTPISTIIFVSEMTNSYHLLLPSLLVCSLAYLLSRKFTIYTQQVPSRIDSRAHLGDFFVDVLGAIRVKELLPQVRKVEMIPEDMSFSEFRKVFSATQQHYFPVVDRDKKLTGIFSINDIRSVLFTQEIGDLVLMKDIANTDIIRTTPSEDLNEVLKKFTIRNLHRLPVVREDDPRTLIGMLDRREVIQYYNQRVGTIKSGLHRVNMESDRESSRLKQIRVDAAMSTDIQSLREETPVDELEGIFERSRHHALPVVNSHMELTGIVSRSDIVRFRVGQDLKRMTIGEYATKNVVIVTKDDSLFLALSRISQGDYAILPVLESLRSKKVLGVVSRRDIINAYENYILGKAET